MTIQPQSILWRIYASAMVLICGIPTIVGLASGQPSGGWFTSVAIVCGIVGAATWAFGLKFGPSILWKSYAIVFGLYTLWTLHKPTIALVVGNGPDDWASTAALITAVGAYGLLCVALFRGGRHPSDSTSNVDEMLVDGNSARMNRLKARI